jgi:hypothetical protein
LQARGRLTLWVTLEAESGGLWKTGAGGNRHVPLSGTHRAHDALSKDRGAEERSADGWCRNPPQDPTREAPPAAGLIKKPSKPAVCT